MSRLSICEDIEEGTTQEKGMGVRGVLSKRKSDGVKQKSGGPIGSSCCTEQRKTKGRGEV